MKYYSEELNKLFDTEEELTEAELNLLVEKEEQEKAYQKVKEAKEEYESAMKRYHVLKDEYLKKYSSISFTTKVDSNIFDSPFFNLFK